MGRHVEVLGGSEVKRILSEVFYIFETGLDRRKKKTALGRVVGRDLSSGNFIPDLFIYCLGTTLGGGRHRESLRRVTKA